MKSFLFKLFPMMENLMFGFGITGNVQGAVGEVMAGSTVLPQGRLRLAFDEEIYTYNLDKALLLMLLSKMKKRSVGRDRFYWQSKARKADFCEIEAGGVGGDWSAAPGTSGTLKVGSDDIYLFAAYDVIQVPAISTDVNIIVTAVNQSTRIITGQTVDGSSVDMSSAPGEDIFRISNAFEIGSGKGTIISQQPTEEYNYIQIVQTPIGITTSAMHYDYRGTDEWNEQRREAAMDHSFKLEKQLFFGIRGKNDTGTIIGEYPQYYAGGLMQYLSTNVTDIAGGALTEAQFGTWVKAATKYAKSPIIFAGERVYEALTTWSETKLEVQRSEDTLGMAVSNYMTAYGDRVKVVPHRELLTDDHQDKAFCIDLSDLQYVHLEGLDTHMEIDIQQPDLKQKIDEFRTWMSLQVSTEIKHGLLEGVGSISTS